MRILVLFSLLALFLSQPLSAQEHFEIAVYPYATAHRGEWEFEGHLNVASRGTTGSSGTVAPTQDQWRFAAEVTHGITDHLELAGYVLGAHVPGMGFEYAGWRLRSRVRAPESWRLPVNLGFNAEYEATQPAFSESARTVELTAVFERRFGDLQLLADPTFERDLAGPEHEWEFEPKARAGLAVSRVVTLGFEWYGSFSEASQSHQFYPTADLRLGDDISWHVGMGFGSMSAGDRLVLKTAIEIPLGGEH